MLALIVTADAVNTASTSVHPQQLHILIAQLIHIHTPHTLQSSSGAVIQKHIEIQVYLDNFHGLEYIGVLHLT